MDKNQADTTQNAVIKIDYSQLMDLRIDFAFKTFVEGNPEALISLLNAIFANAKIKRVVKYDNEQEKRCGFDKCNGVTFY